MQKTTHLVVAGIAFASSAIAQFAIVAPPICATTEGSANNVFPWGRTTDQRYQQIFDSTTFSSQNVTYPILINNLRIRANATASSWPGGTWPGPVDIMLSTSPNDFLAFSTTFASNQGPDLTTVYSGPVTKLAGTGNGTTTPAPWFIDIALTTPFLYDSSQGDLTLDVLMNTAGYTGIVTTAADAETGAVALCSRLWADGTTTAVAAGSTLNYGVVTEFGYVPASGLYASFGAAPTAGPVGMTVGFTDTSFTSDPAGVTSWTWDLDGDGLTDSNLQHPSFTYNTCGAYNVTLTVTDASHPASTLTRSGYIQVGVSPITPSFTFAPIAPGVYQFTDTSTPVPTAWAWDLDGDGIPDSTLQNPVWAYASPCTSVAVGLQVWSNCAGPWATTTAIVIAPNSFTTLLTGGNGLSGNGSGNTFDINVHNPNGVTICGLSMCPYSTGAAIGAPLTCTVWVTDAAGGYLANHTNAAVWRQVATGVGSFAGGTFSAPVPVPMALSNPIYLPSGTYGMAVHMMTGAGVAYTTLTVQTTYPGPDFDIICGNGKGSPFSTTANNPRAFNGTFHYSVRGSGDVAGYGFFGSGCPSSLGISHLTANAQPVIGTTMSATIDNLPTNVAIMLTGLSKTSWLLGALPFDLSVYGAPGCFLRVSPDANLLLLGSGNQALWPFTIPNAAGLVGVNMYSQAVVLSPGTNAAGAVGSDAAAMMIGL
ncbi:MAG: PKD domain-containing protein [Planctomycetota bacterium]